MQDNYRVTFLGLTYQNIDIQLARIQMYVQVYVILNHTSDSSIFHCYILYKIVL
jgi:hypothetical protein